MLKSLAKLSYRIFGKWAYRYRDRFKEVEEYLKMARLPYTLDEFISLTLLLSLAVFFLSTIIFIILFWKTPLVFASPLAGVLISLLFAFNLVGYPRLAALSRASSIEATLPFALMHMSTLAGSGIPPHHIFRIMGKIKKYGEIAKECQIIYRDTTLLGKDIFTALSDAARYSPSRLWTEILWGISSTLRTGGSLRDYLYLKSRELQSLLERQERESVETMNMITEIYLIIFVTAPILTAILLILASMMVGGNILGYSPTVLFGLLVYVLLPAVGLVFVLISDRIRPREVG